MELDPEFTLIVGENGSGKTSLIDALAVSLTPWLAAFRHASTRSIDWNKDVRQVAVEHGGLVTIERKLPTIVRCYGSLDEYRFAWEVVADNTGQPKGPPLDAHALGLSRHAGTLPPAPLPLIARFGTERSRAATSKFGRAQPLERSQGYVACLRQGRSRGPLEEWMRWQEEIRLQRLGNALADKRPLSEIESPHLEAVEEAVCRCIPGATRFQYDISHKHLRISFADGRSLPFGLLSGGYQSLVVIVADLAWRAVVLNPHLGREAAVETAGVALIDEIDLHLHPRWQRTVIENLRRAFPRLQFVATTHSPQVLSSAKGHWVRLLSREGRVLMVDHVEGRDSNALLEDIFGTDSRPLPTKEKLRSLFELIDRGNYIAAKAALEELEPLLGAHDADIVRARWLLEQEEP